jgi:hypothetical protein
MTPPQLAYLWLIVGLFYSLSIRTRPPQGAD